MRLDEGELEQAQHQLRSVLNRIERTYMDNVKGDNDVTKILRGPQGRLFLGIQVI